MILIRLQSDVLLSTKALCVDISFYNQFLKPLLIVLQGYIASVSREKLCLHTLNGRPIAVLSLQEISSSQFSNSLGSINTVSFHEREYSYHGVLAIGDDRGQIALFTWVAKSGVLEASFEEHMRWELIPLRWPYMRVRSGRPVTAVKFIG